MRAMSLCLSLLQVNRDLLSGSNLASQSEGSLSSANFISDQDGLVGNS